MLFLPLRCCSPVGMAAIYFSFVNLESNSATHRLARLALELSDLQGWVEECSPSVARCIEEDCTRIPSSLDSFFVLSVCLK